MTTKVLGLTTLNRGTKGEFCLFKSNLFCQEGDCSKCEIPNQKRILVDIDGVVCEYEFDKLVYEKFHVFIDAVKIYAYNLADVLGVSSKQIDEMFHDQVWGKPNFNKGAIEVLSEWESKGYKIIIFSNRIKYMGLGGLAKWLRNWEIPFSDINGGQGSFDFHIDDRPEKLCDTVSRVKLLYSQPWNLQCLNIENKLTRVNSWAEIKNIVG